MAKIKLTYDICYSAGMDAGNASMRNGGRTAWNEDDRDEATRAMNELLDKMGDPATSQPKEDA